MAKRRRAVAVLAVAAVAGAGVAAGVLLTRVLPGGAAASSAPTATSSPAPLGQEAGLDDVSPTATASIGPDPGAGQEVATDAPVVTTGSDVAVTATYAEWDPALREVVVGGYVAGVVENGGTCTLTLTRGGQTVEASVAAAADASTTMCGAVSVGGDRLTPGTWSAVLSYRSDAYAGEAEPWDVEVLR